MTRKLRIGDVVRQGSRVIQIKGNSSPKRFMTVGLIVKINKNVMPPTMDPKVKQGWIKLLGRTVDVLWSSGKLHTNFAENSLELVSNLEE